VGNIAAALDGHAINGNTARCDRWCNGRLQAGNLEEFRLGIDRQLLQI
jgi:hypothetical protein